MAEQQGRTLATTDKNDEDNLPCHWGPVHPACCDRLRRSIVVLVLLCCAAFLQGTVVNGLVHVNIATLEKRFNIPSTQSGLIASSYDIGSLLCLIPVGYLGGVGSKPRWLGAGIFIMALGSIIFTIPQFAAPLYQVSGGTVQNICHLDSNGTDYCSQESNNMLSNYRHVLNFGQFLHGVGASPLYTLGITYLDESLTVHMSSLYIGIYYCMAIIGPAVGYLLGGYLLTIYTDFYLVDSSSLDINSSDSAWVGAWWLGFLMVAALFIPTSLLLFGLPKYLPFTAKLREERESETHKGEKGVSVDSPGLHALREFPHACKILITNPSFMCLNLAAAADAFLVSGLSTFGPKYLTAQFGVSPSMAAIYVGAATVPAGGGGMLLGGYIPKRFSFKLRDLLVICISSCIVAILFIFSFFIKCPTSKFAGVNMKYLNSSWESDQLTASCNANCQCNPMDYKPVCGADIIYFSPCSAGCSNTTSSSKNYTGCQCIAAGFASDGQCNTHCNKLAIFLPLFAIVIFCTFINSVPGVSATLRCVPDNQKSFAISLQWIMIRCLGSIPGPVVFGAVIDKTCLLWDTQCDGKNGSCHFYDNDFISRNFMLMAFGCKILSLSAFTGAWICYKPPAHSDTQSIDMLAANDYLDAVKSSEQGDYNLSFNDFQNLPSSEL